MKKQEFLQKIDEVIVYIAKNDFQNAVTVADTLDLELLTEPGKLVSIAKAYEKCRRYIDAGDLLELAREYAPKSRSILFHLCNVTTKAGELKKAEDYLSEFEKIARGDSQLYILQYRLASAKNAPDEELIRILENYWNQEPNDRWLYVLAELYAKNGKEDRAIEACNEITLWFDSGKYVRMAEELRSELGGIAPDLSEDYGTEGWDPELIQDMKEEEEERIREQTSSFSMRHESYVSPVSDDTEDFSVKEPEKEERKAETESFDMSFTMPEETEEVSNEEEEKSSYASIYSNPIPEGYVVPTKNYIKEETEEVKENEEDEMIFFPDSFDMPEETEEVSEIEETEDIKEPEETKVIETPAFEEPVYESPVFSEEETEKEEVSEDLFTDIDFIKAFDEEDKKEEENKDPSPVIVPIETQENEFEADTEGAKALREKTELSMSPDEWDQIVFDDSDDEVEEAPVIDLTEENTEEEHVVISVTTSEKPVEKEEEPVKEEGADIFEVQFDWDEEKKEEKEEVPTEKEETETEVKDEFEAEFVFPEDSEVNAAGASDKDMLDMLFDPEEGTEAVNKELQRRKTEKALFGNIPIRPSADDGLWHFIVYGETSALTLECAREEIKEIESVNASCPEKMLKISASKIKGASIINSLDRFLGSTIIVEEASKLSDSQLRDFTKILDKDDRSLLVIFTDTRDSVIEMLKRMPALGDCFTGIFEGKRYTPDDLVVVAKDYLFTEAAKLSKDAEELVYEEGRRLLSERKGYYRNDIIEFVSSALKVADKGGFLGLMGGKCDKEGYLIVSAKHFKKAAK